MYLSTIMLYTPMQYYYSLPPSGYTSKYELETNEAEYFRPDFSNSFQVFIFLLFPPALALHLRQTLFISHHISFYHFYSLALSLSEFWFLTLNSFNFLRFQFHIFIFEFILVFYLSLFLPKVLLLLTILWLGAG